ncbi:MAG: hypothetical protein V1808_02095 [Candidatus Daviesbacteria bacterium]
MRVLESRELEGLQHIIDRAAEMAQASPCQKSQRGAVVFINNKILGTGYNEPPYPFECDGAFCRPICSQFAIHAEQNAIYNTLKGYKLKDLQQASIFHIKVEKGVRLPSNDLSCAECSKLVLKLGLKEFILFQDRGYVAYDTIEFHKLTLEYLKSKI